MAVLLIFLVLVLGYQYAVHIPAEQIKLRRSAGWETYVYLGFHGLRLIVAGLLACIALSLPAYLLAWFVDSVAGWFSISSGWVGKITAAARYVLFDGIQVYHAVIAFFAYCICQNGINERKQEDWQQQMKHHDPVLQLLMQSMYTSVPVRISLKSRKVYVGHVLQEQFSSAETDYILVIPLLSGYRDKDKLDIFYDCNYSAVYDKHHLFDDNQLTDGEVLQLKDFRVAIRGSEIESVALFKPEISADFEYYAKPDPVAEDAVKS